MLRTDPQTGAKGVRDDQPAAQNTYNHNFQNRFCGCGESYDSDREKGTMFQCLGLGTVDDGGCGEDWWHPECLVGLSRDWYMQKTEAGENNEEEGIRTLGRYGRSARSSDAIQHYPDVSGKSWCVEYGRVEE